jgi:long-chain acyl-CoA synthetase
MDKPWFTHYDPGVPHTLVYPDIPLHRLLEGAAERFPDRIATIYQGATLTYRQLDNLANRFANTLLALGVKKGDRVAFILPNSPQFLLCYYGALKVGATVVATNPLWVEREVEYQMQDCGAETIVVLSRRYPLVKNIRAKTKLKNVIVTSIKDYFPPVIKLLYTLAREKKEGDRQKLDAGDYDLVQLIHGYPEARPDVAVKSSDIALLQYTGGTTGISKGAVITHANLICNTMQIRAWLAVPDGTAGFLAVLPFFHVYGMVACMSAAVGTASTMILHPRFDVAEILKNIQKYRPEYFPGVPTMYVAINNSPLAPTYNLSSIKACISGAAPLPKEVKLTFEKITGGKLCEGYGLSEAPTASHCNPLQGGNRTGSIGLPFPDVDCKIVDLETGTHEMPLGEIGELCLKTPQIMQSYWNRPDETAIALRDGWLYTGDIARMDEEGYFYIVDRKKDMVISGGYNVYPRDVEEVLYTHPKVQEAAVAGVPDPKWGESIKAFIVLKHGQAASAEEIIDFCKQNMARYKVPSAVEFRDSLPKTLVGKVLRRVLVEESKAKAESQEPAHT